MNETIPRPINVISNKTFHFLKVSFTHFLEISQNLRAWGVCRIWLKLLDDVCVFVFQFLNIWMTLISGPRVWFGWITLTGKLLCCCFQIMCIWPLFMWFFCRRQKFFIDYGENTSSCIMQLHSTSIWCFWHTYLLPMGYHYIGLFRSPQIRGYRCQGISGSKTITKMFFSKNLNNH